LGSPVRVSAAVAVRVEGVEGAVAVIVSVAVEPMAKEPVAEREQVTVGEPLQVQPVGAEAETAVRTEGKAIVRTPKTGPLTVAWPRFWTWMV